MKFGHAYKDFLEHGGFPADWIASAISYQQLKKCIKRVKSELASLGLDPETLQQLLERAESSNHDTSDEAGLRYEFEKERGDLGHTGSRGPVVRPKLLFLIDEATGEPVNARLSPETKRYIHELALNDRLTHVQIADDIDDNSLSSTESRAESIAETITSAGSIRRGSKTGHRLIEIPLTSDHQFFDMLQTELSGLAHLQDSEKHKIHEEISEVGNVLVKAIDHHSRSGKADLDHWRRIFELYMDSRIFFNIGEKNHGVQQFSSAQERYNKFLAQAKKADLLKKFKRKESMDALQHFLHINVELLQNLRFQEINQTAMVKILKKFDKRTSLNAKSTFPTSTSLTPLTLSKNLSQALSQEITTRILSTIPSLDDYSCPVCSELAWRPVRLHCSHIFCIRCLIRLQREKRDRCPLCREDVVMQADSTCLDESLMKFMKEWFPGEVKSKQRINEQIAIEESLDMSNVQAERYRLMHSTPESRSFSARWRFFLHGVDTPSELVEQHDNAEREGQST